MLAEKKERIRDRMLKATARLWGVPEHEIETNYDPLILLMLDACASELEKLGYDLNASQTRLLDRLAGLVLPETLMGPKPASCIVQATPADPSATLQPETKFYTSYRTQTSDGQLQTYDHYFTPIGSFLLHRAALKNVIIGDRVYTIGEGNIKTRIHKGGSDDFAMVNNIILTVVPDPALKNLKGLGIYFDMRGHSQAASFYQSLENSTVYLNGRETPHGVGYYGQNQFELGPEEMMVSGHDYISKINRSVAAVYRRQILHLSGDETLNVVPEVPAELSTNLPDQVLKQLSAEPKVYIKIALSRSFQADSLEGLVCSINTFPVINRKFNTINYRTDAWVNIIPLQIEGHFLDLAGIRGASGNSYRVRASSEQQGVEEGEALVRSSGVGKTDSKEVREIIGSLMEAIRDESAYFSELSNEFLLARLREITQILARLEDQLAAAKDNKLPHHYVLLRPKQAGEQVVIQYWTTDAEQANNIRSGTMLTPHNHTLVDPKSTTIVSNTVGGASGMTAAEKKLLLKEQLMSKGSIVSAEDIRLHCHRILGERLKLAEIRKGIQIGAAKSEGFVRTIEVHLTFQPGILPAKQEEVDYLCNLLEHDLREKASPVYPFKVIVV